MQGSKSYSAKKRKKKKKIPQSVWILCVDGSLVDEFYLWLNLETGGLRIGGPCPLIAVNKKNMS